MNDYELNELELAPASVVKQAARDFAATLAETPQFKAYEEAADRLNRTLRPNVRSRRSRLNSNRCKPC